MPTVPHEARLRLSPVPASVRDARGFVGATLGTWGCPELEDTVALLVSELVTNVVLHARTPAEVVLRRRRGGLRAEVHDHDRRAPQRKTYGPEATTGRGLGLLAALSDGWGVEAVAEGKVVWFEVGAASPSSPAASSGAVAGEGDGGPADGREASGEPPAGGRLSRRAPGGDGVGDLVQLDARLVGADGP